MKILDQTQARNVSGGNNSLNYDITTGISGVLGSWVGAISAVVAVHALPAPYNHPLAKMVGFVVGGVAGNVLGHVVGAGLYHVNQRAVSRIDSRLRPAENTVENTAI